MDTKCDLSGTVWYEDAGILCGCTQAGKKRKERHDCAVIALSIVVNQPYELCYQLLRLFGYVRGKGVAWRNFVKKGPFKWRFISHDPVTLSHFTLAHPTGSYFCILRPLTPRCHALAIVDGIVLNGGVDSMDEKVELTWKCEGLKKNVF